VVTKGTIVNQAGYLIENAPAEAIERCLPNLAEHRTSLVYPVLIEA
jgi:hypothetical protein